MTYETGRRGAHSRSPWAAVSVFRLKRAMALGLKSLWLHRLRSLLTVLGIVFGVCSVIAMLAIGEGASFEAQEQIRQLGSNNIILRSVKPPEDSSSSAERTFVVEYGLKYHDMEQITATIPGVEIVAPARIIRQNVWGSGRKVDCDIVGTVPEYPLVTNQDIAAGRFFTEEEIASNRSVCVIDQGMAQQLYPIDEAIGRNVSVGDNCFRIVGVMGPKIGVASKGEGMGGATGDSTRGATFRMYIPLSAARSRFGEILVKRSSGSINAERVELHEITVKVAAQDDVLESFEIIQEMLEADHKKNDYEIVVPLELLRRAEETKRIFSIVLGSVAAISLLVGGIGIMNIMLATVTERTREIGIRRALGAKRRDVVFQFLIETVLLSGAGGVIGVVLGLAVPFFITVFADMKTIVTLWSPMIAFSISAMVGVIFGIYPAVRAADMDPVEALRHE